MKFAAVTNKNLRAKSDALVVPIWLHKDKPTLATDLKHFSQNFYQVLKSGDFAGKKGESFLLYDDKIPETRVLLIGLGDEKELSVERLRRAYSVLARECMNLGLHSLNLYLPWSKELDKDGVLRGVSEGLLLPNYLFHRYFSQKKPKKKQTLLTHVNFLNASSKEVDLANKYTIISEAVYIARDLVNSNADDITPQHLAQVSQKIAKEQRNVKATVLTKKEIQKEKMGLLLAVNKGSSREPTFIILEYTGKSKQKERNVIVGKGITYDTGGLSLKTSTGMETMKSDMAGAAACIGVIVAASKLNLPINITAVIASTENCIGPNSIKPGDVFSSFGGKTVEVNNTDAEGRLILADALGYIEKYLKPTRIIDLATLTGAAEVALGSEAAALFTTDEKLANALIKAGETTFERLWRMPLFDEYREYLKSDIADVKNTGGRYGGACIAASFLQGFVQKTPWAHIDIASVAFLGDRKRYLPKHGTGFGIRLLIEFFENLK